MTDPPTPKSTRKAEALSKASPTITSRRKEDAALKEVTKSRLCYMNGIFETKTKDGTTGEKVPDPRTNPNTKEAPTAPKPHTHPSHECDGHPRNPGTMTAPPTPKSTRKAEAVVRAPPTITSRRKEDATLKEVTKSRLCYVNGIFETKTKDGTTGEKTPVPRTNPNTKEAPTAPKPHTRPSHPETPRPSTPSSSSCFTSSSILSFCKTYLCTVVFVYYKWRKREFTV
jgi:DNA-binding protein H-NS